MTKILVKNVVRPCVIWFSEKMESKLRKHDRDRGRRGWKDDHSSSLCGALVAEVRELNHALDCLNENPANHEHAIQECADVANFAMMIADVLNEAKKRIENAKPKS